MNHVCLVSEQAMPNFLPVLNKSLRPETVTLVVSSKMTSRAAWLRSEIERQQVRVLDDILIGDEVADLNGIQKKLIEWADAHKELVARSILNVTGGTKPMAIAAQEVFRMMDRPVFYVDVATDVVTWVSGVRENVSLTKQPTLNQFFGLNGVVANGAFKSVVENEKWRFFGDEIAKRIQEFSRPLGRLNYWAAKSVEDMERARDLKAQRQSLLFLYGKQELSLGNWQNLLDMLHAHELIAGDYGNERFISESAARFCAGAWLEHYVFVMLKKLGFDKRHAMMNVEIKDVWGNRNEFDSIVLSRNNCFVIEDKTRNMKIGKQNNAADNAIYKLAHLTRQMGLRTHGILVSARPLRPVDCDRARAVGISVIDYLPDLEKELKRIVGC